MTATRTRMITENHISLLHAASCRLYLKKIKKPLSNLFVTKMLIPFLQYFNFINLFIQNTSLSTHIC